MMEQTTLIQCECHGWMNPRAVFCPTCGLAGPGERVGEQESGFPIGAINHLRDFLFGRPCLNPRNAIV